MTEASYPTQPTTFSLPTDQATVRASDRGHVFHSWSAQGAINPLPIARAEGSRFWDFDGKRYLCLLYTSPSPRDRTRSRMPSSA